MSYLQLFRNISIHRTARTFNTSAAIMGLDRIKVASTGDLPKDYSMKEVEFKDQKVLLSKVNGKFYATGAKCTHYGAPLSKGVITSQGRIVCPWHGACFNAKTGDIEDAPAPNNLQSFKVEVEGSDIYVTADAEAIKQNERPTKMKSASGSEKGVVVVGGGSGALYAVEGLRESGYTGSVKVISRETYIPIDRTKLSKALIDDAAKLAVRPKEWYTDNKIDLVLGKSVTAVDIEKQTVTIEKGETVSYSHLILATGSEATRIPVEGADLGNVFVIRTIDDTKGINKALAERTTQQPELVKQAEEKVGLDAPFKPNLVIIGSSFIGMEAALAGSKKANVTVIGMEKVPFESILGPEVGAALKKNHEKQGIKFHLSAELAKIAPSEKDSKVAGKVVLKSGEEIDADVVLLGTGAKPITDYATNIPGIIIDEKGKTIEVDEQLRVKGIGKDNVFAIGDIARYPDVKTGELFNTGHWNVAGNHGRSVAATIAASDETPFNKSAIFWSAQGAQLRYVGNSRSPQFKDVYIDGNPEDLKFVAYYGKGDEIVAVASMGRDPVVAHCSELFTLKKMPTMSDVKGGKSPLDIPLEP